MPNSLSISRIIFLPVLAVFTVLGWSWAFFISYIILGSTDFFDGKLARYLKQTSEFGKTIDSIADLFFYLGTLVFVYFWFPHIVAGNRYILAAFFMVFFASFVISWVKLGKPIMMHTNLLRLNAVMVYFLVIISFVSSITDIGQELVPVYLGKLIIAAYVLGFLEEILIFIMFGEVDRDTRYIWDLFGTNKDQ